MNAWTPWFAWYPVRLYELRGSYFHATGKWAFLRTVSRHWNGTIKEMAPPTPGGDE